MPEYLAPAVYVEEVSFRAPSIEGVGTTTTGFVGPTLTGPVGQTPEMLTSFGDFQSIYGGFDNLTINQNDSSDLRNINYMALSVKAFFDNGGSMLYVSRVFLPTSNADTGKATKSIANTDNPPVTLLSVNARFPGAFASNQIVTVTLVATKTMTNTAALPQGSLVALTAPYMVIGVLQTAGPSLPDEKLTLSAPFSGANPTSILVDGEVMGCTADATKTILTVTRGQSGTTAVPHQAGALVLESIGMLSADAAKGSASIVLAAALTPPAAPVTLKAVQIGDDVLGVTAISGDNLTLTVTPTSVDHKANDPVFGVTCLSYYANAGSTSFANAKTSTPLPSPLPAGGALYVLTMNVGSFGAASPAVPTTGTGQPQAALSYSGLGFDPHHPSYIGKILSDTPSRHADALQNQISFWINQSKLGDAISLQSQLFATWGGPGTPTTGAPGTVSFTLGGGNDGAEPQSNDYDTGLNWLDGLEDIAIIAAPGSSIFSHGQDIAENLITHVSKPRAYRVAILDPPLQGLDSDYEDMRAQIDSTYAALYVPWIKMANPLARTGTAIPSYVYVPPSGFMAGIYARNDDEKSVAKAPANEVVLDAVDFERRITFAEQQRLNPLGINCLRYFPDRGFRVWAARTVGSDSDFMYINPRRYMIYLEHSIDNSTQWAVFENNGPPLWARVKDSIDSFLTNEFAEGRLLGTSPADSFFVRCDRTTMTQNDLDNGRMVCLVGVSVFRPAEFVIFRIGQWTADARS